MAKTTFKKNKVGVFRNLPQSYINRSKPRKEGRQGGFGLPQGQLNEDKLKGKLRSLENQLYTCTQMEDQKNSYEQKAKETLQKVLEGKMSAEQQLQSKQWSLALAEQKCEEWKSQYEALKEDWRTLGTQHRELESQLHVLQSKLQGADSRDLQMNQALRLLENECQELQAKTEHLQGDRDLCSSDTQHLQDQLKRSEEEKLALVTKVQQLQNQALPGWSPKPSHNEVEPEGPGKKDWNFRDQLQKKTLQPLAKEKEAMWPKFLMLMALMAIAVAVFLANKDFLKF